MKNTTRNYRPVRTSAGRFATAALLAAIATLGWGGDAQAQNSACLAEAFGGDVNCTANDIRVASITVGNITESCDGTVGDTFTFDGTLNVQPTATTRYDIGFYIGADPQNSPDNDCFVAIIPPNLPGVDTDADGDQCGDTTSSVLVNVPVTNVVAACVDVDNDNFFDVNVCSSWGNSAGSVCNGPEGAVPETKAKCNCEIVPTDEPVPHCTIDPTLCEDNNICTNDVCNTIESGLGDFFGCTHTNNSLPCADGLFCNGAEVCTGGSCQSPGDPCLQGDVCDNVCNEESDNCLVPAGTTCRAANGVCDSAEVCTGTSAACPANDFQEGTLCRAANGVCDAAESCSGTSANCPADTFEGTTTQCRDAAGVCDTAEVCSGTSANCPGDAFQNGTLCRASAGVCDATESCSGTSASCPTDTFDSGNTCRAANGICDVAETCTGSAASCPNDAFNTGLTCRIADGVCDTAETCTGNSADCPADGFQTGTICRIAGGVCDAAETCTGTSADCPIDIFGTEVCRPAAGVCDQAESCSGTGGDCPPDGFLTVECRGAAGVCDVAEACTGSTADCPTDEFLTTECRGSAGVCDVAETCTGSAANCPADAFLTTQCRESAGVCDVAETCSGTAAACPADTFSTAQCRAAAGICDVAETCTGSAANCPADAFSTTQCRAAAGVCDVAETCTGSAANCPADAFLTTQCRASSGVCDAAETCTGSTANCPADAFAGSTTQCRASAGVCDIAENCTGTSGSCPANTFSTTQCRAAAGICDAAEICTGTSATCPADVFRTTQCRASAGICDVAETCTGSAAACPADVFRTTQCRAASGECDLAETCTGSVSTCPADVFKQNGTQCTDDSNICTNDICTAGQCTHPNNRANCNDGLFCTENDRCTNGSCIGSPIDCRDDIVCTFDTCNEATNQCQHVNACEEICRRPTWWGKRGGNGDNSLVQELLDTVGGLEVCGQTITEATVGDELGLSSAIEGLCVSVSGDPLRALYRELVAASLNCAISGASEDCDLILNQFVDVSLEDCNELCEFGDATSSSARACRRQLECYNNGGRVLNGKCSYGSCSITGEFCGGDFGPCPPFTLITIPVIQKCERFDDNCRDQRFCNEPLGICPDRPRVSSRSACREAKDNDCTITNCD